MQANVLGTAVEYDLPVVWVVWNNYAYASIRGLQRGYLNKRELATDFRDPKTGQRYNPDFAAMARSCGVEGVRVDRAGDMAEAIRKGIAANRPYLIDVDIAADINPAGAGVWELPGLGQSKPAIGTRYNRRDRRHSGGAKNMKSQFEVRIVWGDCDEQGIVFYPKYFYWMDSAFQGLLRDAGQSLRTMRDDSASSAFRSSRPMRGSSHRRRTKRSQN